MNTLNKGKIIRILFLLLLLAPVFWLVMYFSGKGNPPLTSAAWRGDLTEVRRLVEEGASIDQKDMNGETPLEGAMNHAFFSKGDNYGVTKYLIAKGASVKNPEVLEGAILGDRLDIVKEIVSRGEKPKPDSLAGYIVSNVNHEWNRQLCDYLLDSGTDINSQHEGGLKVDGSNYTSTALGFAVHYRDFDMVKYLVEKGADVNKPINTLTLAEEEYRVNLDDNAGPGTHYYRIVPPSPEIANYLKQHGAR